MFSRLFGAARAKAASTVAAAAAVAGLVLVPSALNAPAADAAVCPAVVVVAARGSGQSANPAPAWYSNQGGFASNGWEGDTVRAMLQRAEGRYAATHGGNSMMKDVYVMGLSPNDYPATFPDYFVPNVAQPTTFDDVVSIVAAWAQPVLSMGLNAATQFNYSVQTGRRGVMNAIDGYERASGCRPQYILTGFSQGGMILTEHERELAHRGQLAGALYVGSPMVAAGDPATVGSASPMGGMLGWAPLINTRHAAATPNRINYCLPTDTVCDISPDNLREAATRGTDHGMYFARGFAWDDQVFDALGRWVDQARFR